MITWGDAASGGNSTSVAKYIQSGVVKIIPSRRSFVALKKTATIVAWGEVGWGSEREGLIFPLRIYDCFIVLAVYYVGLKTCDQRCSAHF